MEKSGLWDLDGQKLQLSEFDLPLVLWWWETCRFSTASKTKQTAQVFPLTITQDFGRSFANTESSFLIWWMWRKAMIIEECVLSFLRNILKEPGLHQMTFLPLHACYWKFNSQLSLHRKESVESSGWENRNARDHLISCQCRNYRSLGPGAC